MSGDLPTHQVLVEFVGPPPTPKIKRAQGVSEVMVNGSTVRCLVCGSFQQLIEAVRGYEMISLESTPVKSRIPQLGDSE